MFFSRAILAGLALVTFASAQDARVAFTSVPAVVSGGDSYNITWGGGDGSAVTITLRQGDPNALGTVGILADSVEGDSYLWKVSEKLETADNYALQITQGQDQINYSGQFSLVKGSSNSTSTSSASGSATTSMSSNSTMTIGLGSNSTMSRNATMTSSMPRTIATTPLTSAHSATNTAGSLATNAPDSAGGAMQMTSSAAFVVGIFAAVAFLS